MSDPQPCAAVTRLLLASTNRHKQAELEPMFETIGIVLQTAKSLGLRLPEVVEDGETIESNAILKARTIAAATGRACVADDTVLEVDALNGRPGLHTARFAGQRATARQNRDKLLHALLGVPDPLRTARFVCCLCVAWPGSDKLLMARGICKGRILQTEQGPGGFGYDSLFWIDQAGCTMAELSPQARQSVTHRAAAFAKLARDLGAEQCSVG